MHIASTVDRQRRSLRRNDLACQREEMGKQVHRLGFMSNLVPSGSNGGLKLIAIHR